LRIWATIHPTASPIATPPAASTTNFRAAWGSEKLPATTAATATRYATSAVASLKRPSPSMALTIRRGASRRRMIVAAASGSVGDTIAPRTNAASHGRPGTSVCAAQATAHMVTSTSPTVLSVRARTLARRSPKFAKIDAP
jgi:hypothetical protein